MINLDPEVRKFLLYTVSETFAEIRKFVEYKQYDRDKTIKGLQELCVLFGLGFPVNENEVDETKTFSICRYCGKQKRQRSGKRKRFPYHSRCEAAHRKQMGDFKIMKLEDV